jgi:hypothetical protein
MNDLTTIHLHAIFRDPKQLAKLHEIQMERCEERAITGGDRPQGMRLSCADPIRRVKSALDPFWAFNLDDGLAERGYMIEDLAEVGLLHGEYAPLSGKAYEAQHAIQWHEHGVTALDFLVESVEGSDRPVSIKSKDPKGKRIEDCKPSAENASQERRMLALGGYPAGTIFEIWMGDPGTLRLVGPYEYTLEQEHIDDARRELAGVSDAYRHFTAFDQPSIEPEWNDPEWWRGLGLESTSGAFRFTTLDASGAIEARNRGFLRAREAAAAATRELDAAKDAIRVHVEEQIAAAVAAGEQVKSVAAYSGNELAVYTLDKRGAMRCTVKPFEAAETAA